ncbi:MAG: GTPase Era [Bacilli bacterium]|nr:GTPase Era [Bacilli bacterium]
MGRPNAGKSTLVNALLSKTVSIVSPRAQTTRDSIMGILNEKGMQIVFIDTPGLFVPKEALGKAMVHSARESAKGVDAIVYLIDGSAASAEEDEGIIDSLGVLCPLFICVNKIDLITAPEGEALLERFKARFPKAVVMPMSALTNFGLKEVKDGLGAVLKDGPQYFPSDALTDKDKAFQAKEAVRFELLRFLDEEVPHQCAVVVNDFKEKNGHLKIEATVFCEKKSQVGIVVGKGGAMIKKISMSARHRLEAQFHEHVTLLLEARFLEGWRDNPDKLAQFGYGNGDGDAD